LIGNERGLLEVIMLRVVKYNVVRVGYILYRVTCIRLVCKISMIRCFYHKAETVIFYYLISSLGSCAVSGLASWLISDSTSHSVRQLAPCAAQRISTIQCHILRGRAATSPAP
jgi:hypothetical protein